MKKVLSFLLGCSVLLFFCAAASAACAGEVPKATDFSDAQLAAIGIKIMQNQCSIWNQPGEITPKMKNEVTGWEKGYHFSLIGMGPYIWYAAGVPKELDEDWPKVARYLKTKKFPIAAWMLGPCPWNNEKEFRKDFHGEKLTSLRNLLTEKRAIVEQARFIAQRLDAALPKMMEAINKEDGAKLSINELAQLKKRVARNYNLVAQDYPRGLYAMMDYVHFTGEGVLGTERIKGVGWGLRQVLEQMDDKTIKTKGALAAFVAAAKKQHYLPQKYHDFAKRDDTYLTFDVNQVGKKIN